MAIFRVHKVSINQLPGVITESLLSHLSEKTKVDCYSKVLHGKKLFYLLMYGILENDRLSQRTLEDTFNDPVFKVIFNLEQSESVCRSSISERLSKIDSACFRQVCECIYEQFSEVYSSAEKGKYNLIRVDSKRGLQQVTNGKKSVKYSIALDGILPGEVKVFTLSRYSNEDTA